jgi:hypothetical protein
MKRVFAACAVLLLTAATAAQAQEGPSAIMRCTGTGGVVQSRTPEYGTNGTTPLVLAHPKQFCAYTAKDGSSSIYVLLRTLDARQPTLAALAYYAEVPFNSATCPGGASPGSCYCSQIGGTDLFGGVSAAGGAWVDASDPINPDLDACVFPDLSIIDSYGLFYHSAGIIRGRNLDGRLAYKNPYAAKPAK